MREILFRGKAVNLHNGSKDFVYGQYVQNRDGKMIYSDTWEDGKQKHYVIDGTVGQYTGLTDKNGKKIYEGDILRTGTRMGYILFEKGCFRFRWKNFDKYRDDFFKTCIITEYGSFRELEVIGNIHDNPELLEGGAE